MSGSRQWSPAGWPRTRLKFFASCLYGLSQPPEYVQEGIPFVRATNVNNGRLQKEGLVFVAQEDLSSPRVVRLRAGDIIVVRSGALTGDSALVTGEWDDAVAGYDMVVRVRRFVEPRFIAYSLLSHQVLRDQIEPMCSRAAQPHLNAEELGNILFWLAPLPQQRSIADYLDRETARLDGLVAAKERVLALLAEKRRALITRAVTRGLDSRASLRDTGIAWLGEIPAHWETRRVAWLFRERDERGEPDLPLLEVSINAGVALREFSEDRIESTAADFNTYKVARKGDVVFNKMRMWQGAVGVASEDGLVSPDYTVAAPSGSLLSDFAGQLFRTEKFSAECARRSHGIVWDRLRLYWEGFRDIELPLPTQSEQRAILAHIEEETGKLDALRAATERTIALLKERRAALIAAAVTGAIKLGVEP